MANKRLKTLGLNIKFYRMKQGLSQEELAEKTNVSRDTISNIETGRCETSILTIIDIAQTLNVDINNLTKDV